MIPIVLIISAVIGAATAVGLAACFWNEIKQFLKETLVDIQQLTSKLNRGCKVFIRRVKRNFSKLVKVVVKYYMKENDRWERISYQKMLEESDVPLELLEQASNGEECDISKEMELYLMQ